jgi:hypothetical protein
MFDHRLEMETENWVFIIGLPSTLKSLWNFMCYVFSSSYIHLFFVCCAQFAPLEVRLVEHRDEMRSFLILEMNSSHLVFDSRDKLIPSHIWLER